MRTPNVDVGSGLYLLQRRDRGALSPVVWVPIHVQNLLPIHRHDPGENALLPNTHAREEHYIIHTDSTYKNTSFRL